MHPMPSKLALVFFFSLPLLFHQSPALTEEAQPQSIEEVFDFIDSLEDSALTSESYLSEEQSKKIASVVEYIDRSFHDEDQTRALEFAKSFQSRLKASKLGDPAIVKSIQSLLGSRPKEIESMLWQSHRQTKRYLNEILHFSDYTPGKGSFYAKIPNAKEINDTAARNIRNLVAKIDDRIEHTDFSTPEEMNQKIIDTGDPVFSELHEMVNGNKLAPTIRTHRHNRRSIARYGFLNLHATGVSGGNPYIKHRNISEAKRIGIDLATYKQMSASRKPKYGYLKTRNAFETEYKFTRYGSDQYIIDLNKVSNRTTWFLGDSLGISADTNLWSDSFYLPWSIRWLMTPGIFHSYKKYGNDLTPSEPEAPSFSQYKLPEEKISTRTGERYPPMPAYLELQFHGVLSLDHVKEFRYAKEKPYGVFLSELKRRRIKISKAY